MTPPPETDEHEIWADDGLAAPRGMAGGLPFAIAAWIVIGAMIWAAV